MCLILSLIVGAGCELSGDATGGSSTMAVQLPASASTKIATNADFIVANGVERGSCERRDATRSWQRCDHGALHF